MVGEEGARASTGTRVGSSPPRKAGRGGEGSVGAGNVSAGRDWGERVGQVGVLVQGVEVSTGEPHIS
jgi:hypothetical protein